MGGRQALDRGHQVLDPHRHAAQRPGIAGPDPVRRSQRALVVTHDEGIQLRIALVALPQRGLDHLSRRHLAPANERGLFNRPKMHQLMAHGPMIRRHRQSTVKVAGSTL
jgi:hypothetical protein